MILYLTYNDQPSGVYWGQVTDVVEHLNTLGGPQVRLVALVSGRSFFKTRKAIKTHSRSAIVLPMVPTMKRWKSNTAIVAGVCRLLRPTGLICRGPFAAWMALRMRDRGLVRHVCFDGRGAYAAEWEEYRIVDDDALIAQFRPLEHEAVNASDLRIAVSHALVDHWRERYGYRSDAHVVIPCTLGRTHGHAPYGAQELRKELGYSEDDVVLVYSGSTAGWQSFPLLEDLLAEVLTQQPAVRVLFLAREDANNRRLMARFPGRVQCAWLAPDRVAKHLAACDHGLLIREDTITNRVASPTKFAEYLAAGLPVIVSEHLGDFSALTVHEALGMVWRRGEGLPQLKRPVPAERRRIQQVAADRFTKRAYDAAYRRVLAALSA